MKLHFDIFSNLRSSLSLMLAGIVVFLMGLTGIAAADIVQDLTVHLNAQCLLENIPCNAYAGFAGSPATGSADFRSRPSPWSYQFTTGPATSWTQPPNYQAEFDCTATPCGSFTMTGPYGLTFTGAITQGESSFYADDFVMVDFVGWWSNGIYGYGHVDISHGIHNSTDFQTFAQAPEPSSLAMLGTGVVAVAGAVRRRLFTA